MPFSGQGYKQSNVSFLFSLKNKDNVSPFIASVNKNHQDAIYSNSNCGPSFGSYDLCVVMTLIPINNHSPTLVTHTSLQQNMATILNKHNPFLLEVIILHQLKLKYFIKLFNKLLYYTNFSWCIKISELFCIYIYIYIIKSPFDKKFNIIYLMKRTFQQKVIKYVSGHSPFFSSNFLTVDCSYIYYIFA